MDMRSIFISFTSMGIFPRACAASVWKNTFRDRQISPQPYQPEIEYGRKRQCYRFLSLVEPPQFRYSQTWLILELFGLWSHSSVPHHIKWLQISFITYCKSGIFWYYHSTKKQWKKKKQYLRLYISKSLRRWWLISMITLIRGFHSRWPCQIFPKKQGRSSGIWRHSI